MHGSVRGIFPLTEKATRSRVERTLRCITGHWDLEGKKVLLRVHLSVISDTGVWEWHWFGWSFSISPDKFWAPLRCCNPHQTYLTSRKKKLHVLKRDARCFSWSFIAVQAFYYSVFPGRPPPPGWRLIHDGATLRHIFILLSVTLPPSPMGDSNSAAAPSDRAGEWLTRPAEGSVEWVDQSVLLPSGFSEVCRCC